MSDQADLERRLKELEESNGGQTRERGRPSALAGAAGVLGIIALGGVFYMLTQDEEVPSLPTAQPDEFQAEGEGFGAIEPFAPPVQPEPEVRIVETPAPAPTPEPNTELLEQLAALRAELDELRNAPQPAVEDGSAAAAAIDDLTSRIASLQDSSEAAEREFQDALAERDRQLEQMQLDLELARLQQPIPAPSNAGSSDQERRLAEEEARRLAELQARRDAELAFQQARIDSPLIAFGGGSDGDDSELSERTFGAGTDFVLNGALPTQVTQAEIIANPSNTVVQGTMIQAVTETALDSSLPGQVRAVISEDVHSFDGSRILIPRGSRLIGRYRSGADIAQERVTIGWDRIILPNNQTVTISSFGGDELGRSGVTGQVDTRFGTRFGSAALISVISALPGAAAAQVDDDTSAEVLEDVGDDLSDSSSGVIDEYLSIGPVIYVDQGSRITVMVDRDLEIF